MSLLGHSTLVNLFPGGKSAIKEECMTVLQHFWLILILNA